MHQRKTTSLAFQKQSYYNTPPNLLRLTSHHRTITPFNAVFIDPIAQPHTQDTLGCHTLIPSSTDTYVHRDPFSFIHKWCPSAFFLDMAEHLTGCPLSCLELLVKAFSPVIQINADGRMQTVMHWEFDKVFAFIVLFSNA